MTKIINNNIRQTNTTTKQTYWSTLFEVKRFVGVLDMKWEEKEVTIKGVSDKLAKGKDTVKVATFHLRDADYWKNFVSQLEKGEKVFVGIWEFEVEEFTSPEIIKAAVL
jgi:hypothetical protein